MPHGYLIAMFDYKSLNVSLNLSEVGYCMQFLMIYKKMFYWFEDILKISPRRKASDYLP